MMGLTGIILILTVVMFVLFIKGVLTFKRNRTKALIMAAPFIMLILLVVTAYNWFSHVTTPDSLDIQVYKQNSKYTLKGQWRERHEPYSYGTDFLVFYVPDNQKIELKNQTIDMNQVNDYVIKEVTTILKNTNDNPIGLEPQIFPIELMKRFDIDYHISPAINSNEVLIKYVHLVMDPMSPTTYWVKEYKY